MIRKIFFSLLSSILFIGSLWAKEGMYLPYLLQKINASEMQAMGMKITAEEIYSVNHSSLKDAIVHFGGGCTAEIVSEQGLLLTNHHCGYRSIQNHSSVEQDYLKDGFWAPTLEDELPNKGLTATILQRMRDVTDKILIGVKPTMTELERQAVINKNIKTLLNNGDYDSFTKLEVKAFYYGNQYILMVSKVFKDVRLVGAPPSNIGKFGGDTDNWMWPRHTGDFSVFRIYADVNNNPCDYSEKNKPYKPAKALDISLKGYSSGDFTFVFGYPGTTQEYLPSQGVALITEKINPFKIDIRRQKLDIMDSYMKNDKEIRIQYSAKYAGVANGWKKWIGENKGIKQVGTIAEKQHNEVRFKQWARDNMPEYSTLLDGFKAAYKNILPWEMAYQYFIEAGYYQDIIRYSYQYNKLIEMSKSDEVKEGQLDSKVKDFMKTIDQFYKDYNIDVEKELLIATISAYQKFPYPVAGKPEILTIIDSKYKGDVESYVSKIFDKSIFASKEKMMDFMKSYKAGKYKKLQKDPIYKLSLSYFDYMIDKVRPNLIKYQSKIDSLQHLYMKALLKQNEKDYLFPDANSTLRIAYGQVEAYEPHDGVEYTYFTTLKGVMEKENPEIFDYVVEEKLKKLYESKDYDMYGDADGTMHVCFLASNHTTGGNSGSPVLNAEGQLIGLNFDRNWEGTMSDLNYDPDMCRNISLDIRYCLFIIDKFAGAHRLIEEMNIIQ